MGKDFKDMFAFEDIAFLSPVLVWNEVPVVDGRGRGRVRDVEGGGGDLVGIAAGVGGVSEGRGRIGVL